MEQTALAHRGEHGISRIKNYIMSPETKQRFSEMMGPNGIYYLNQVMIVVANNTELQKCEPKSILLSAMRAASLKLSVDPTQGQAWIIPYNGKAIFQLGYRGVYELALRTNQYRFINVIDIFEGEEVVENRMTGMHVIKGHRKTGGKVIGYMLYFQLVSGFEKTFYMTVEGIDAHARKYSKSYRNPKSLWNDPDERPKMERKTVLVNGLRKWGRFDQADLDIINQIESEQGWSPPGELPDEDEVTPPTVVKRSEAEIMDELGYEPIDVEYRDEPKPKPEPAAPEKPPLRYQPEALKARLAEMANQLTGQPTREQRGLIAVTLESALSMTTNPKESRHQLIHYLTDKSSLTDLPDGMVLALYKWLSPAKNEISGEWFADEMAVREAIAAFNAAQPAQETLF